MTLSTPSHQPPATALAPRTMFRTVFSRLWRWLRRPNQERQVLSTVRLGELNAHMLRDIGMQDAVHGQTTEHAELASYDREQAARRSHEKWL